MASRIRKDAYAVAEHRYGHMVHEYYVARLRALHDERMARLASLRTASDARRYVLGVRRSLRRVFGPFPARTPLNAVVTGRLERAGFDLERVTFESRPGHVVTANLYLPRAARRGAKCPCVLGACGHGHTGKAFDSYQRFCRGLVSKGFVVLVFDPVNQGERHEYFPKERDGVSPTTVYAHNLAGNPMTLVGDALCTWFAWDGMRALDYLLSRPEVDSTCVGVTGNSGGGLMTRYLAALDPRPTMVAASCEVTSYLGHLLTEFSPDAEQCPPGVLAAGLDHADFLVSHAPRPTLVLAQYDDTCAESRYARETTGQARRICGLLGRPEAVEFFEGPRTHGFGIENREAMYAFFMKHAGLTGRVREPRITLLSAEQTWATPGGEVHRAGGRPAFDFTAARARALAKVRGRPDAEAVRKAARAVLSLAKAPSQAPSHRCVPLYGCYLDMNPRIHAAYTVETEPGIQVPLMLYTAGVPRTRLPAAPVVLYVGHTSSQADVRQVPEIRRAAESRRGVFASVDPRGIGQSQPLVGGAVDFFQTFGNPDECYANLGGMLHQSYAGRRVWDVLRTIDLLLAEGVPSVTLLGRGLGSLTAAFAALLHPSAPRVRLLHYLPSYELIVKTPRYGWPLSSFVRGCLCFFDLPDVYRALGGRLRRSCPWDASMRAARRVTDGSENRGGVRKGSAGI